MPAIEVADLTYRYGRFTALDGVDLEVPSGAVYALLGPNGAGKTTLLQVLMGLRRPTAGAVSLLGRPLSDLGLRDRAAIGYVAEGQRLPGWIGWKRTWLRCTRAGTGRSRGSCGVASGWTGGGGFGRCRAGSE